MITKNEKRELRIDYQKQMIAILRHILGEHNVSDEFCNLGPNDKFFDDACQFINLRFQLIDLINTLRHQIEYTEIIMKAEKDD